MRQRLAGLETGTSQQRLKEGGEVQLLEDVLDHGELRGNVLPGVAFGPRLHDVKDLWRDRGCGRGKVLHGE